MAMKRKPGHGAAPRTAFVGRRLIDAFMLVLLLAGALKSIDIIQFQHAVKTWPLVPEWASFSVALGVANLEMAVALGWLLKLMPRVAFVTAASGLLVSIAVFVTYIGATDAPDCGCFGLLSAYYGQIETAEGIVLRNAIFLLVLLGGGVLALWRENISGAVVGRLRRAPAGSRGFTIIELLVTIALVAVLISLVSPTLDGSRRFAKRAISVSNARQHAGVFSVYANEFDDQFPYFVYRDAQAVVRCGGQTLTIEHWESYASWNHALAEMYYDGNCRHPSFYPPDYPRGLSDAPVAAGPTPYWYGCSFIARPAYWNQRTRRGPSQWGATRQSSILFPTKKGLLFAYYPALLDMRLGVGNMSKVAIPTAFVDAHAETLTLSDILFGYPYGDGRFGGGSHHLSHAPQGLHTIDGGRGMDVR